MKDGILILVQVCTSQELIALGKDSKAVSLAQAHIITAGILMDKKQGWREKEGGGEGMGKQNKLSDKGKLGPFCSQSLFRILPLDWKS